MRKKINNTVQILTHVKEKLQFVNTENEVERERLRDSDQMVKTVKTIKQKSVI